MANHLPTKFAVFAEAVAKLAADAGLNHVHISMRDGWESGEHWPHAVNVTWARGRHGAAAGKINLESTISVSHSFATGDQPND